MPNIRPVLRNAPTTPKQIYNCTPTLPVGPHNQNVEATSSLASRGLYRTITDLTHKANNSIVFRPLQTKGQREILQGTDGKRLIS